MKIASNFLLTLPAVLLCSAAPSSAAVVGVFHNNYGNSGTQSIFVFGAAGTTGSLVRGTDSTAFAIDNSGIYTFSLGEGTNAMTQGGEINTLAFRIDANSPISAIALNRERYTTDQTNLLDVEALGRDHVVLTTTGTFGGSQMSVTAVEDGTEVQITSPVDLNGNPANTPINVTLNKGESVFYTSNSGSDLSGARVTANKDIAVFAGAECTNVPVGVSACDHLISQQYSVDNFDTEFLISNSYGNGELGDLVRVVGATDNTEVFLNGVSQGTINAGQVLTLDAGDGGVLTSSQPVTVGQFMRGQEQRQAGIGDPAYEIIPSTDQFLSSYFYATPVGADAFTLNYLSLAIAESEASSLKLNGSSVDTSAFSNISGWLFGTLAINTGIGTIEAANPFLATISGYSDYDSYFSTIATAFSPGVSPPVDPAPVPVPAAFPLLGAGLGILGLLRRKRRSA
ncbi:IgGFc-binding protein [Paracoccus sp. S3-43]|uniref:IgGFc-binding protein n=1 Tax=Paracoccus sp. S3-43 TaxID=3030011 RepID=UPI0023B03880|nr:IgGFc-binding protein [Paracoccus sp. S3-43]WEF24223.1 IgGFc-binding protein [Paracoccus sp. S3-43]